MLLVNLAFYITLPIKQGLDLKGVQLFVNTSQFLTAFCDTTDIWVCRMENQRQHSRIIYVFCNFSDLPAPLWEKKQHQEIEKSIK